jgi:hypothetical protein
MHGNAALLCTAIHHQPPGLSCPVPAALRFLPATRPQLYPLRRLFHTVLYTVLLTLNLEVESASFGLQNRYPAKNRVPISRQKKMIPESGEINLEIGIRARTRERRSSERSSGARGFQQPSAQHSTRRASAGPARSANCDGVPWGTSLASCMAEVNGNLNALQSAGAYHACMRALGQLAATAHGRYRSLRSACAPCCMPAPPRPGGSGRASGTEKGCARRGRSKGTPRKRTASGASSCS